MPHRAALLLAAALAILAIRPDPSAAQGDWELNVHAATLLDDLFPESGGSIQAGARLIHTTRWRLTVGGNFDWARTREIVLPGAGDVTANLLLASAEVGYAAPLSPRTDLMIAGGAGRASVRLDGVPPGLPVLEESSGFLIPVGVGVRFRNRPTGSTWAFRADVRDQVILLDVVDPTSGDVDQEPRHNLELSAGLSLLFGGAREPVRPTAGRGPVTPSPGPPPAEPRERPETQDADRDGVPDRLDRCARTPSRFAVGPTGCPIDMDRDGVPDPRDGRTLPPAAGPEVRAEAPPPLPVPEAADAGRDGEPEPPATDVGLDREPEPPAPDRDAVPAGLDTDRDGVTDAEDRCVNTPRDVAVDERGCPAAHVLEPPAPPADEEPAGEDAGARVRPAPAVAPAAATDACLDARSWNTPGVTIAFDGRLWEQLGPPEPITSDNLRRVGDFDGVPIFVASVARPPFTDIWVPRCDPAGAYQLYVEEGTE